MSIVNNIPNPLPDTLPIGTKILWRSTSFISLSVGVYEKLYYTYVFNNVKNVNTGREIGKVSFDISLIIWDELPNSIELENKVEDIIIVQCKWCNEIIDNGMDICSSHKSKCSNYWEVLTERMSLDLRKPEDALEYERVCVKNFVDNKGKK